MALWRCIVRVGLILAGLVASLEWPVAASGGEVDFARDVRPILAKYCFKCHGPDEKTRTAGLRLDVREAAVGKADSGHAAIVPGDVSAGELLRRVSSTDDSERMPPPATKMQITAAQREILRRWIEAGAEYRQHWAFLPITSPQVPAVKDAAWPRGDLDRFILQRLENAGLTPTPPADRETLIRRVTLDLVGFTPTPEEVDAFLQDESPGAYERLVDRLLESPHYGERWARRWLDLARYADTNGYEKDRARTVWPYRDWVIEALNSDVPFDQFTIEQLAGDMLPGASLPQRTATGFHRNTMLNEEGGIDPLEFRFHAMTDRMATTGTTWLGLTLGCAQCHTHKYDPIPQREYYQLMSLLNNADEPELELPGPQHLAEQGKNRQEAQRLRRELPAHWPLEEVRWESPRPRSVAATPEEVGRVLDDGSVLFMAPGPERATYTMIIETAAGDFDRLRIEALVDDSLPKRGPGRTPHGNFVLSEVTLSLVPADETVPTDETAPATTVKLARGEASAEQAMFPVRAAIDGDPATGWAVHDPLQPLNTTKTAVFFLDKPITLAAPARWTVTLSQNFGTQHTLGRVRVSLGGPQSDARPAEERRAAAIERRFGAWLAAERGNTTRWTPLKPLAATSTLPLLTIEDDATVVASGDMTKSDTYELKFAAPAHPITAIRLEALPDERLPMRGPGRIYYEGPKGDFYLSNFTVEAQGQPVKLASASQSFASGNLTAALALDGDLQSGWSINGGQGRRHTALFRLEQPLSATDFSLRMLFERYYACGLGKFRISVTDDPREVLARDLSEEIERLLSLDDAKLTADERAMLRAEFLLTAPELAESARRIRELERPPVLPTTLVFQERPPENPRPTFIHDRGEYLRPTERVEPGVLSFLPPLPEDAPKDRLSLARWLVSAKNPLTPRVVVNRQWEALFGRGLVLTSGDFGIQGEPPSHPELLDWLATEFIRQGWSLKKLHRLIVISATYRQSSQVNSQRLAADPENRLLSRGPRFRLEAELIRDSLLRASGLLSYKRGGPSVFPAQPANITTEGTYGALAWTASQGEDRYRRSLYTFSKRTAPFAMSVTFDAPSGEACVARRDVSNTAIQALTLLNDVMFVEAAQAMAERLVSQPGEVDGRIETLFRRSLARRPTAEESAAVKRFFGAQRERFTRGELDAEKIAGMPEGAKPETAIDRAAWTVVARAVFNLDEMVTRN